MLMLFAAAQIHRLVVAILDMQPDRVFVELAAGVQVSHVEHGVTAPDDVEGRIEDVLRNGHVAYSSPDLLILMVRRCVLFRRLEPMRPMAHPSKRGLSAAPQDEGKPSF